MIRKWCSGWSHGKTRCLIIKPYLPLTLTGCMGGGGLVERQCSLDSGGDDGIKRPKYFYCGEGGGGGEARPPARHTISSNPLLPSTTECQLNTLDPLDSL